MHWFRVRATCWTKLGRPSTWSTTLECRDVSEAIDRADQLLARAGHVRYQITATQLPEGGE